jgi:hypothetical protein
MSPITDEAAVEISPFVCHRERERERERTPDRLQLPQMHTALAGGNVIVTKSVGTKDSSPAGDHGPSK